MIYYIYIVIEIITFIGSNYNIVILIKHKKSDIFSIILPYLIFSLVFLGATTCTCMQGQTSFFFLKKIYNLTNRNIGRIKIVKRRFLYGKIKCCVQMLLDFHKAKNKIKITTFF